MKFIDFVSGKEEHLSSLKERKGRKSASGSAINLDCLVNFLIINLNILRKRAESFNSNLFPTCSIDNIASYLNTNWGYVHAWMGFELLSFSKHINKTFCKHRDFTEGSRRQRKKSRQPKLKLRYSSRTLSVRELSLVG